jgi:copper chaperone CopZ
MHCNACEKTVAKTISKCKGICVMSSLFWSCFLTWPYNVKIIIHTIVLYNCVTMFFVVN